MENLTTSWMWPVENGINGLIIDTDKHLLKWYDEIGCVCSDDDLSITQSINSYLSEGVPVGIQPIPADIKGEIATSLAQLQLD